MAKKEKLEKLNREIRNCKKCRLWKLRKNTVPGAGPVNAKIIILGMAPGVEEDKIGKPFIGRAGKFYFPTYYPAAGLRFPKTKKILEKDFKKLKT